jgi:hypothetical protein
MLPKMRTCLSEHGLEVRAGLDQEHLGADDLAAVVQMQADVLVFNSCLCKKI